ncbi:anoctamin-9 isoform X2 [Triplophysa dalaica]|uniref:anoctamin-9 isoform X2 n=1 Tax=Triplophysa dalaica TaxID=1582913 RepID=UPI0024DF76B4|nr:anoctamin-9 isoform X2 [Triplophysa dalaica]
MCSIGQEDPIALLDLENGNDPLLPSQYDSQSSQSYDYVLVADIVRETDDQTFKKQDAYIRNLKLKNIKVTIIEHMGKVFYGICAPEEIFAKYKYLLKVSDACNWSGEQTCFSYSTRIRVVHFVIHNTFIETGENLEDLLAQGVFKSIFCLHEENNQKELKKNWASWSAIFSLFKQPMDHVKDYFGEKVALYYLWLGWYTRMLIPAAFIGIVVFLYGIAFFNTSPLIKEVCDSNIIMCPRCDHRCHVWNLSDTCTYAKVSQLFDNEGTVAFAMFMAIWATLFLELWKRHRALYVSKWNVYDWCEEEEELILEIVNDPRCRTKVFRHSYLRTTMVLLLVTLVLVVIIGLTQALVICRILTGIVLSESDWHFLREHASTIAMLTGAVLHYITIQVMTRVNRLVALKLCSLEKTRSMAATEKNFTVKMFTFQFFTLFSSLFYVAFFLGRINGYPGNYIRIAGKWRLEECHPSGCLTDLFIQMSVILLLKQTINNIFEFAVPWLKLCCKRLKPDKIEECQYNGGNIDSCDPSNLRNWLDNYHLTDVNCFSLFNEFLEMVIQFSFTTIFVAAFPLAPLLALINNIFEIRLDAIKMVSLERRLVPKKTNDIGVWTRILEVIGVMAVIANGLVIGITSDFIPRLVYRYYYGPCANGTSANLDCMTGYINGTLATAYMSDVNVQKDFFIKQMTTENGINVSHCSYRDYRNDVDQNLTPQFWLILAFRFAFVILFEHVVVLCKFVAAWFIPDSPIKVKNSRLKDKFKRLKEELQEMNEKYDSRSTEV